MPVELNLSTLGQLQNGTAAVIIDAAINAALNDLDNRGHDERPRKVIITTQMAKLDNGTAAIGVKAKTRVPEYVTASTLANMSQNGRQTVAEFEMTSPRNPNQRPLPHTVDPTKGLSAFLDYCSCNNRR
jgi:hypothetical protein